MSESPELVSNLLPYGNFDFIDSKGLTPLMIAIKNTYFDFRDIKQRAEIIKILIDNSNCNIQSPLNGKTALMYAHKYTHACEEYQLLVDKTDLSICDHKGRNMLFHFINTNDKINFDKHIMNLEINVTGLPSQIINFIGLVTIYFFEKIIDRIKLEFGDNFDISFNHKLVRWERILISYGSYYQLNALIDKNVNIDLLNSFQYYDKTHTIFSLFFTDYYRGRKKENRISVFDKILKKGLELHGDKIFENEKNKNLLFYICGHDVNYIDIVAKHLDFYRLNEKGDNIVTHATKNCEGIYLISFIKKIISYTSPEILEIRDGNGDNFWNFKHKITLESL